MVPLVPSSPIEFVRRFVRSGQAIPVCPSAKEPRMNNIVAQQMACTYQPQNMVGYSLEFYHVFDLVPIPLKIKSRIPLVRRSHESLKPAPIKIEAWVSKLGRMDIKPLRSYKIDRLLLGNEFQVCYDKYANGSEYFLFKLRSPFVQVFVQEKFIWHS